MKKEYKVAGMSCNHCRRAVEEALNALDGVTAVVTLDPAIATVEFKGKEKSLPDLQAALDEAGGYTIAETE